MKRLLSLLLALITILFLSGCSNQTEGVNEENYFIIPSSDSNYTTNKAETCFVEEKVTVSSSLELAPAPYFIRNIRFNEYSTESLPEFNLETVAQDYAKARGTGLPVNSEEKYNLMAWATEQYDFLEQPRFFNENGTVVLVFLNSEDGMLYKNSHCLGIGVEETFNLDTLKELPSTSEEIISVYKSEIETGSNIDMLREYFLRKLSSETGFTYIHFPRFFRKGDNVVVLHVENGYLYENEKKLFECSN